MCSSLILSQTPTWIEHYDLIQYLIGGLFSTVAFLMIKMLKDLEKSHSDVVETQKQLIERLHELEKDFYILQGKHEANHPN